MKFDWCVITRYLILVMMDQSDHLSLFCFSYFFLVYFLRHRSPPRRHRRRIGGVTERACGRASPSPSTSSFLEDAFHKEPVPEDAFPNDPFPENAFPKEDAGTAEGGILESIRTIFDRMCLSMG